MKHEFALSSPQCTTDPQFPDLIPLRDASQYFFFARHQPYRGNPRSKRVKSNLRQITPSAIDLLNGVDQLLAAGVLGKR